MCMSRNSLVIDNDIDEVDDALEQATALENVLATYYVQQDNTIKIPTINVVRDFISSVLFFVPYYLLYLLSDSVEINEAIAICNHLTGLSSLITNFCLLLHIRVLVVYPGI